MQQVAGSGPEPNWFSFCANSARTVDDLKIFNVAMQKFLTNNESKVTRGELHCLEAACKTLETKELRQSAMQWVFGEKNKTRNQLISLEKQIAAQKQKLPQPVISVTAQKILTQSTHGTKTLVCTNARMSEADYSTYEAFVNKHKAKWNLLDQDAPPIFYSHTTEGLPRSVTYVPGQGLMIHMKGVKRNPSLERQQLGTRGSQGVVTKAVNFHTGAVVAFKSMHLTPQLKQISRDTIKLHTKLKEHPQMFASGKTVTYVSKGKEKVGLFMPIWEGGELLDSINESVLSQKTQLSYALQMAKSIQKLHSLGYLHRDLKLENILVSKDRTTVVLADFDMAIESQSEQTRYGTGNLGHMAPETYGTWFLAQCKKHRLQENISYTDFKKIYAQHKEIDHFFNMLHPRDENQSVVSLFATQYGDKMTPQSEVFSFGVLMFEMKSREPFKYPESMIQLNRLDPYDKIILDCLVLKPENRPSMDAVISRLEALQAQN